MVPVVGSKKVAVVPQAVPTPAGSQLGSKNGFTQREITGTPAAPVMPDEFDGLKPSAVAVAETLSAARLQMREKNVGRFGRLTVTATVGFTPKLGCALFG
jgi:hypothetical protein